MSPRVLVVDDKPDVVEAVRRSLDGFDVHTAATMAGAMRELQTGGFELILCDPAVGDPWSLEGLSTGESGLARLIIEKTNGATRRKAEPRFFAPDSGREVGLSGLKSLVEGSLDAARKFPEGATGRLRARLLEIMSSGAEAVSAARVVRTIADESRASYVAFGVSEGGGLRIICDAPPAGKAPAAPSEVTSLEEASIITAECGATVWMAARAEGPGVLTAAFERGEAEGSEAFAACAGDAARFLAASTAGPARESVHVLLSAVYDLVHDTRNSLTGLSLVLDAYRANRNAGRPVGAEETAILDQQVTGLGALCREYAYMDAATRLGAVACNSGTLVTSFATLADRLGIATDTVYVDGGFSLPALRQGTLARSLLSVAMALVDLRASRLSVTAHNDEGRQNVRVSFSSGARGASVANNRFLREAESLVSARGGEMSVENGRSRALVTIEFAECAPRQAERELTE